jgi:hypothetical protein
MRHSFFSLAILQSGSTLKLGMDLHHLKLPMHQLDLVCDKLKSRYRNHGHRLAQALVERGLRERAAGDPSGALVSLPTGSGDLLQVFLVK